jgi:hypothetical protein
MRRRGKLIFGVALLAGVVAALALWGLAQDPDRFRPQLAELLSEAAGVPVKLDGPMRWSWQPTFALEVSQVWFDAPSRNVRIDRLKVSASTSALLRGELRVQRLFAADVIVDLKLDESTEGFGGFLDPSKLPLDRLEVEHLRLQRNGEPWLAIERMTFDGTTRSTKIPLDITFDAALGGQARMQVDGGHVWLHDLVLRTPAGEMRGMLDVDLAAQPPRLSVKLHAERLAITPQQHDDSGVQSIPRVPLDISGLQSFDAEFELAIDALAIGKLQLQKVLLPARLQHGHLHLTATAGLGGGTITVDADVRAARQHWASRVQLGGANAGQLLNLLGLERARDGGVAKLDAALEADGEHTDALLRSLRGDVSLRLSDVSIEAGATKIAATDVFVGLTQLLRGTASHPIEIGCAVADFKVRDGLLRSRDSLGAQTAVSNLLGGGVIALPDERMDLIIRLWPREGLGLSVTALSGPLSISGPLLHPQVALTEEAVWRSGATVGAAVFTGGLSLIAQGLLERAYGDTPCEEAMGQLKVEHGRKNVVNSVSESGASATKSLNKGADNVADTVREGVQGLGESLKGLFGGDNSPPAKYERSETQ